MFGQLTELAPHTEEMHHKTMPKPFWRKLRRTALVASPIGLSVVALVIAALSVVAQGRGASTDVLASPDPYVIYTKAMQHLATLPDPRYIIDTQRQIITTLRNGEVHDDTENVARYVYDTNTRLECGFFLPFNRVDQPAIGRSYFAPDTWLVRKGFQSTANATLTPDLSDLKTIASIIVVGRPSYDIRLVGIEPLTNEGSAYHLILRPRFDPVRHNLRELWVNTVTYNIVRAVIEGVYKYDPSDLAEDTFVTEDFGSVGGYWLVIHKTWSYAKPFSPLKYEFNFTSMSMQFPPSVPPWLFDPRAFSAHTFNPTDPLFKQ